MAESFGNLRAAHRGYIYQDVVTAYFMAQCLANQSGSLTVDKKLFTEDRFDDLTIHDRRGCIRRQFKRSDNPNRPLKRNDFTQDGNRLRLNHLIRTYKEAGDNPADEYRLCVPWIVPTADDIAPYLKEVEAISSFDGYRTRIFQLRSDTLWPDRENAIWSPLRNSQGFTREDFVGFSQRFFIELECPHASVDFRNPLQLEKLIIDLLANRVGIGRYPNQYMDAADVAESLAWRAYQARTKGETVELGDIEKHLRLRRDYGREAQLFPVVKEAYVSRDNYLRTLEDTATREAQTILVGPPGSGKSWSLDNLAEKLKRDRHLVARHYCYLEPGDEHVERRVTTNVLFANIIAELVDSAPKLREKASHIYAAGLEELESLLPHAVEASATGHVYLFVDGIDHIARVVSEKRSIAAEETNIIEELAVLNIPDNVHLVIGTQPGPHIALLHETSKLIEVPHWETADITKLAKRLGVLDAMHQAGFMETDDEFIEELAARVDGNPLYAKYLCNELKNNLNAQVALEPVSFIKTLPPLNDSLGNYYGHLLRTSDETGGTIANLLGAIDFAVTEQELQEIFCSAPYQIPKALTHLKPVLTEVTAQGGIRIYHESFRRFILERLNAQTIPLAAIVNPIITWLQSQGFWNNAKAYRFLLPLLRRAERNTEILDLVGHDFASKSVSAGHPKRAIDANLDIAIEVAAEGLNWAALARYAQLRRSIETCFEENFDTETYGRTYAELFGYQALADRLLFDGRPTTSREQGLVLCSICDDEGVTAPWHEYLDLPESVDQDRNAEWIDVAVAQFHGRLQSDGPETMLPKLVRYLNATPDAPTEYLQQIFRRYARSAGKELTDQLLRRVKIPQKVRMILEVEYAKVLRDQGNIPASAKVASILIRRDIMPEIAHELILLGCNVEQLKERYVNAKTLEISLLTAPPSTRDIKVVEQWVAAIGIVAHIAPDHLEAIVHQIHFEGWYGLWLRYVIALSRIEVDSKIDANAAATTIISAFQDLASDTHPFRGDPRACDLYYLWPLIHRTISRGLRLLQTEEQWVAAAKLLVDISYGTTAYLQGSQNGPLTPEALSNLIMPYIEHPQLQHRVTELLEEQVQHAEKHGEYYSVHATHEMFLSRALEAAGQHDIALEHWQLAARFLCAYGMRKDTALFDVLECAETLAKYDPAQTSIRLGKAQKLTEIVVSHTDGRETNHIPNTWFRGLCKSDLIGSIDILYRSLIQDGGEHSWILERAVRDVTDEFSQQGNPALLAFISATQPFVENGPSVSQRLEIIKRVQEFDKFLGLHLFKILVAQVQGDGHTFSSIAYENLIAYAAENDIGISPARLVTGREETANQPIPRDNTKDAFDGMPLFSEKASPLQIIAWIRRQKKYLSQADDVSRFIVALIERLAEFIDNDNQQEAMRIMRYTARHFSFGTDATLLADLAKQLEERGYTDIAAATWALAYARSRGGGGWLTLGGAEYNKWIHNGLRLSESNTSKTIAIEVASLLHEGAYWGVARHLVEMCAECVSVEVALGVWDATYEVLRHRLPENDLSIGYQFMSYQPGTSSSWTIDEALFNLLLARVSHPELKRKIAAIAGCVWVVKSFPDITVVGLRHAFCHETPVSSILTMLQILAEFEQPPFSISTGLRDILQTYTVSEHFGFRWLASLLLIRIGERLGIQIAKSYMPLVTPISQENTKMLRELDWGERVENISKIWPSFPGELLKVFQSEFMSQEIQKERARARHQLSQSRVYKMPATRLLFWERESFELAFHRVLAGISDHLVQEGKWEPDFEYSLLNHVLPKISLHVGYWNSRIIRPPIPLPRMFTEGQAHATAISGEDEYNGWYRCAYYENELVLDARFSHDVVEEITATGGIVFSAVALAEHKKHLPFGIGETGMWLEHIPSTDEVMLSPFHGPLVGFDFINDYLGMKPLFTIHPSIAARCGLRPAQQPGQLVLIDSNEEPACIFRYWNVRALGSMIGEETPCLSGCDLIIRPDIFERITEMTNFPPVYEINILKNDMKSSSL